MLTHEFHTGVAQIKAGDHEHVEPEAQRKRHERRDEQPMRFLGDGDRDGQDGQRFGRDRDGVSDSPYETALRGGSPGAPSILGGRRDASVAS